MSRLTANGLLLTAAFIWGTAFVAQQTAMADMGPFFFTGIRFVLAGIVVLPYMLRERRRVARRLDRTSLWLMLAVGAAFFLGGVLQQIALKTTTVTNAGFLTGLYVVMVPIIIWVLFRDLPHWSIWPAAALSLAGTWLLGGGAAVSLSPGDWLLIACAFFWAMHVALLGYTAARTGRPMAVAFFQFAFAALFGMGIGLAIEPISWAALRGAGVEILYAGLISGGIGFSLQVIGQRHTPPAHAAILLSAEALFAALAGGLLLGDRLPVSGWLGCALIFAAILAVQLLPQRYPQRKGTGHARNTPAA